LNLTAHDIDIWLIEPHQLSEQTLSQYRQSLTEQELARLTRKRGEVAQRDGMVTRAFVRQILSQYEDIAPLEWQFGSGFNGKPFIKNAGVNLQFNLSHATNLIVCAVTRTHDIGIDVEYIKRRSDTYKLAPRYFSAQETTALQALPYEQQAIDFYHYWTLKEAYIKACGDGLAIPLNQFSFTIGDDHRAEITFSADRDDDAKEWQHFLFEPTCDHKMGLSVCIDSKQPLTLTMRRFNATNGSTIVTLPLKSL